MSAKRLGVIGIVGCLLGLWLLVPGASANSGGRVLARHQLTVGHGGYVRAANGWSLYVPPHTLTRAGEGTITAEGGGGFDIHISVPWHGKVAVTAPLRGGDDAILHHLGGVWVPEGQGRGQSTVWVTQLSILGTIKGAVSGLTCLSWDPFDVLKCLALKGISKIDGKLASWIAGKISSSCAAALVADGITGEETGVALGVFKDPACTGVASSPGSPPSKPTAPAPPVPGPPPSGSTWASR